jgi:hypothetical protein
VDCGWLKIKELLELRSTCFAYKAYIGALGPCLGSYFSMPIIRHSYPTRAKQNKKLFEPSFKLKSGEYCFEWRAPRLLNTAFAQLGIDPHSSLPRPEKFAQNLKAAYLQQYQ